MPNEERKGLRIPVISDVAGALKNTTDVKGAIQASYAGIEIGLLLYALNSPDPTLRLTLGALLLGTSVGGLWAIDRKNLTKK